MTTLIMRGALERGGICFRGCDPPPDLAYIIRDHRGERIVTWADVMKERRENQRLRLSYKRRVDLWQAAKVNVSYYDQDIFGGWQALIYTIREHHWIDRDRPGLIADLMRLVPLSLPLLCSPEKHGRCAGWEQWKEEFAKRFRRGTHHRKPRGVIFLWWDGRDIRLRRCA
jgi:hypothetical protein